MKKLFIVSAVLCFLVAGCKTQPKLSPEEAKAAYEQGMEALATAYRDSMLVLNADTLLTQQERREREDKIDENFVSSIKEFATNIIKENSDNEVGLDAVLDIAYMLEPADNRALIDLLSDEMKKNEKLQEIIVALDALDNTAEGKMFVDFDVAQDPDKPEEMTKLSDFVGKGKYVIVDFWASWCRPCREEVPYVKAVYEKYKGDDFDALSIACWDKVEDTRAAAKELDINWNQIENAQTVATEAYGIQSIPQIILFAPDGTILKRNLGGEGIEQAVKEALGR